MIGFSEYGHLSSFIWIIGKIIRKEENLPPLPSPVSRSLPQNQYSSAIITRVPSDAYAIILVLVVPHLIFREQMPPCTA